MKRLYLLSIAIVGLTLCSMATPIDQALAKSIASKFMGANELQLSTTYRTDSNIAALYVFSSTDGFVIVSADDCETPIIGYSFEGRFDPNAVPVQMEAYLQDFVTRIQYGIENHIEADELTASQWELVKNTGRLNESKTASAVEPLLTEMWEQGCLYNDLCPTFSKVPCGHAEAGCIAVAMGQIMHYWRYPETGWGSHSYNNAGHTLSADFGNTIYDWDHMPDSLTDNSSDAEIEAVATLLFHCGVSVNMKYTTNGSGADSGDVPDALVRYFNYSKRLHFEKRSDFNDEEWISMLKSCLDLQRPVFYGGKGSQGSHAFVCDGYDDNDLLHFNWGWGRANGYFALGHLNPIGLNFNDKNFAILDINPEYEPWIVEATAYPSTAGAIDGNGEYHIGDSCTLTAIPAEGHEFYCWKRNGKIISNMPSIALSVEEDILDIEALFSCFPVSQITASYSPEANNPNSTSVSLSWSKADTDWSLLKEIDINEECGGVATDGEYIYVNYAYWDNPPFSYGKYTMDGELLEKFNVEGVPETLGIAYDGTYYYSNCVRSGLSVLYSIDLYNKTVNDSIDMGIWFGATTYDPEYDGFWIDHNKEAILYDRQGQRIMFSPTAPVSIYGSGYFTAKDGTPHLLLSGETGVYDYDITNNIILDRPLMEPGWDYTYGVGAHIGKYDGKDAMFIAIGFSIRIYEIKSRLEQIMGYRIYRTDSEGNSVMLAEEVTSTSYIDYTWNEAQAGEYRFGISEVYANGVESEIIWSDTIVKTDFGMDENGNQESQEPSVQKVIEDGHIVIIKDGKRYSISGQHLN
jgi:hypothetical protein